MEALPVFLSANTFHLDCTYIDYSDLERRVRGLGSNLSMIRTFTFAYHLSTIAANAPTKRPYQETLLRLRLISTAPFYAIDGTHVGVSEVRASAVAYFLKDLFLYRNLRSLAVKDVMDVASFIHRCGNSYSEITNSSSI
ncbi:hypothetical protein Q7P37_010315 [Cladosporium fusiforme]